MLRYDRKKGKLQANTSAIIELATLQPIATQAVLGRVSAGPGAVEVLNAGQAKSILNYTGSEVGFIPYGTLTATNAQAAIEQLENKASSGSVSIAIASTSMVGTVPTVVGAVILPSGTYAAPKSYYGCAHDLYYAILQLVKTDGTVVCTFADKLGVMGWATATAGFELPAETQLNLVLSTNDAAEHAFILQFQF